MTYTPPFVSERLGESSFVDCTVASGMMALGSWTFGEALRKGDRPMTPNELRTLRHQLSRADAGGSNPEDFNLSVQQRYPDLLEMPSWDNPRARIRIKFPEWKRRIQNGECGILQGNAARVRDPKSPLHRFVGDVGHAIYIDRGGKDSARVMDPMGLPLDTYNGNWVRWEDLEQFGSEFSGAGFMFVSLVEKGAQNSVTLNKQIAQLTATLADKSKQLTTAQNRVVELNGLLDKAQAAQQSAESARDALTKQVGDLTLQLAACRAGSADCSSIQALLDLANADLLSNGQRIRNLERERDMIAADRDKALADLAACQANQPPTDDAGLLAFLRRLLGGH